MELRQLRYFESVARHLHFTRAAEELHVAQPAISQQIQALEHELGIALFDRLGRRIQLTEAGGVVLTHTRHILSVVEELRRDAGERVSGVRGRVRMGAPPTVSTHLLPGILASFCQQYPGVELQLREEGNQTLVALIAEGALDLAVSALPIADPVLESAPLLVEELVLAVATDHPLAEREQVAWSELVEESFILYAAGYELREITLEACRQAGFAPRVVLDGAAMDTALRFAAAGLGVVLVPRLALEGVTDLRPLPVSDQTLRRSLGLVWHRERRLLPAARALLRAFLAMKSDPGTLFAA